MTFKVEDGTGLPDATSLCSVEEADAHHALVGNGNWASLLTERKEQLLAHATLYMTAKYRLRWKGRRVRLEQALDWPRVGVVIEDMHVEKAFGIMQVDYTIVPQEVKRACAELALRANIGALAKDLKPTVLSKTVGPISVSYDKDAPQQNRFPLVDMMLAPLMKASSSGAMMRLTRT